MLKIGADPEVFIANRHNNPISAIGMIGGSKETPKKTKHGWVQEDNVAAEFNIKPATTPQQFKKNIENVMDDLKSMLQEDHRLFEESSYTFEPSYLEQYGPNALLFGCEPDINAYTLMENRVEVPTSGFRCVGGHVHIGNGLTNPLDLVTAVKWLDLCLGIPSVIEDPTGHERRLLYGKAGSFREKPYGLEYRTLSNYWIFKNPGIIFERAKLANDLFNQFKDDFLIDPRYVQETIDTGNVEKSKEALKYLEERHGGVYEALKVG